MTWTYSLPPSHIPYEMLSHLNTAFLTPTEKIGTVFLRPINSSVTKQKQSDWLKAQIRSGSIWLKKPLWFMLLKSISTNISLSLITTLINQPLDSMKDWMLWSDQLPHVDSDVGEVIVHQSSDGHQGSGITNKFLRITHRSIPTVFLGETGWKTMNTFDETGCRFRQDRAWQQWGSLYKLWKHIWNGLRLKK